MSNKHSISVIILIVERDKKYLNRCITSLNASAEYANIQIEYIVVLNGISPTNIKYPSDSNVHLIRNKKNIGFAKGINIASKIAHANWLFIINPDTVTNIYMLNELIKETNSNKAAIIAPQVLTNNSLEFTILPELNIKNIVLEQTYLYKLIPSFIKHPFSYSNLYRRKRNVDAVSGVCMLINRNIFNKLNGFDERFFLYFEDLDLCKRMKRLDKNIVFVPTAIIEHQGHQSFGGEKNGKIYITSMKSYLIKYHSSLYVFFSLFILQVGLLIRLISYSLVFYLSRKNHILLKSKIRFFSDSLSSLYPV